jgi:hypothetical protein
MDVLTTAGFFSFLVFVHGMTGSRQVGWVWAGAVSVALHARMWALPGLRYLPDSVSSILLLVIDLPLLAGPVAMLLSGARRRDPDARLLLVPVAWNAAANLINDALGAMLAGGHAWIAPYWNFWSRTLLWPFPFGLYDLSIWMLLFAVMGIVVLRFARSRHEEDQWKSEREAARAVQQVLIPQQIPAMGGFRIESVYKPAGEVGGDFFQILPDSHGVC